MTTLLEFFGHDIEILQKTGVYSIHHAYDLTKIYVGSTSSTKKGNKHDRNTHHGFYKRFYDHVRALKNGTHHSKHLQNVVNKHGITNLKFTILEICENCTKEHIFKREQHFIDTLSPSYNCFKTVHPQGRSWTKHEKELLSSKMKGVSLPEFVYEKIRKPIYQLTLSGDLIQKHPSSAAASRILNIYASSISHCASGKRKSAGGFKWSYTHPKEAREMNLSHTKH